MIRTSFSFKYAVGTLEEVMSRIVECGLPCAPICDRNSAFAWAQWSKVADKAKLRPVYGIELAVTPDLTADDPPLDYWRFFAKDDVRALHKLIALATNVDGGTPMLNYMEAINADGVIKVTGPTVQLQHIKPRADLYVGLAPSLNRAVYNEAIKREFKFFATSDNNFPRAADKEFYRVALNHRASTQTYPQWILTDDEWRASVRWFANERVMLGALLCRDEALVQCKAPLRKAKLLVPKKAKTLRAMCLDGAKVLKVNLKDKVYLDRLNRELAMIDEKKFEDYFYIIADLVSWAKKRMIVGPARGSSCGSLVCYLLGITAIDPLPYGLLFERFIDVTRADLPDIDIDFSDVNRNLVFEHAEKVYGADHVARLGTVSTWQPRGALKVAGASLKIPSWEIEKLLEGLIERSGGDARANLTLLDTLASTDAGASMLKNHPQVKLAARMEGMPSNSSQHAAGIVITADPVNEYVPVDMRTKTTMVDKYDVDQYNLLKIDALGLKQLSVFERTLELIGKPPINGYLETLPTDDDAAFAVLNRGHFAGIFQFTGTALQAFTRQVTIESFNDMIAMTALARPGPMGTGGTSVWVKRRTGKEKPVYADEMLRPFLEETEGVVTYQEQVLKIGHDLGDLSWADVTALRKGMSKSLGQEFFDKYGDKWKDGVIKKGMEPDVANKVWNELCTFGNYGFNKSHAVAYALVSYWCCWLKAHHPMEFAAATLDSEGEAARQIVLLRELRDEGIDYIPVDKKVSGARWVPTKRKGKSILVGPLSNIEGVGPAAVAKVLEARKTGAKLPPALQAKLDNPVTKIDSLLPVADRLAELYPDGLGFVNPVIPIKECQCGRSDRRVLIVGAVVKVQPKDLNEALNVAKRHGKLIEGPNHWVLNWFLKDDTDQMFCRIDEDDYPTLGKQVQNEGAVLGKSIWAVRGVIPRGSFRMIRVEKIKYLGSMDRSVKTDGEGGNGPRSKKPVSEVAGQ